MTDNRIKTGNLFLCVFGFMFGLLLLFLCSSLVFAEPPEVGQEEQEKGPRLIRQVVPKYPKGVADGVHGNVNLVLTVSEKGKVTDVKVLDGPAVFYKSAISAARKLRFSPKTKDGVPVASTIKIYFHFVFFVLMFI